MNHIYKVIWSKVRNSYVAVSETAKRNGKSSHTGAGKKITSALAALALCTGITTGAMAADDTGWTLGVSRSVYSTTTENEATATGKSELITDGKVVNLLAGRGIKLTQHGSSIDIGLKFIDMDPAASPYNDAKASGTASLAVGQGSIADGHQGTAIGFNTHAGEYSFAGGSESDAGLSSVAIGYNAKAALEGSVAIGTGVRKDPSNSAGGYKKVDSTFSVAIGEKAYVGEKSTGSNVIGNLAEVTASEYAVVFGTSAKVNKIANGIAIGYKASVTTGSGDGGVAIGSYSVAKQRAGLAGYDPEGKDRSSDTYGFWKSGLGAVSVGDKGKTRQITQVAAGTYNMDAVNVAQLKALNTKLSADIKAATLAAGDNIAITKDGDTNKIDLADKITLGSDTNQVTVDGEKGQVTVGGADNGIIIGNQEFTVKNEDGTDKLDENGDVVKQSGKYITGLSNTTWDKNNIVKDRAATEGQLSDIETKINTINETIDNTKQTFVGDNGTEVIIGKDDKLSITGGAKGDLTEGNIGVVNNDKGFKIKLSSKLSGLESVDTKTLTASKSITVGSGDTTTVIEGNTVTTGTVTTGDTVMNNDGVTIGDTALTRDGLAITDGPTITKDGITFASTATDGDGNALVQGQDGNWYSDLSDATYDADNNVYTKADGTTVAAVEDPTVSTVKISSDGIDAGGKAISNIGAAVNDSDAINKGTFDSAISNINSGMSEMDSRIGELGGRVNEVGASAAALAALHPLEFDPEDKWNFAAGIGHYKSKSSAALGAFYRMNENTLLSVGGTFGGERMWNAGVSVKLGSGTSSVNTSRTAMAKEIQDLKTQNEEIRGRNQAIEAENKEIKNELAVLKQQIAKLMAK